MSNRAIDWAIRLDIDATNKLVLLIMANRANEADGHICHPSLNQLRRDTSLARSSVCRALIFLTETGLISKDGESATGTTQYRVHVGKEPAVKPFKPAQTEVDASPTLGLDQSHTGTSPTVTLVPQWDKTSPTLGPPLVPQWDPKPNKKPKEPKGRPPDLAFEHFAANYLRQYGMPYASKTADFVKLAELRKRFPLRGREPPERWTEAVANYFATPQGDHTLADLCTRYGPFSKHPLDRYGKPVTAPSKAKKPEDEWARLAQ